MKAYIKNNCCNVTAEPGDKPIYSKTAFFHRLKKVLQSQGLDVIKKLMWKDGHLTDARNYYIRDRKWRFAIYDGDYQIRDLVKEYRDDGEVQLDVVWGGEP